MKTVTASIRWEVSKMETVNFSRNIAMNGLFGKLKSS